MNKLRHPRFLGFLWKIHRFERLSAQWCTKKCRYCEKKKHYPLPADTELLETTDQKKTNVVVGQWVGEERRRCKVCGVVECRDVSEGAEAPPYHGKWRKENNEKERGSS